MDEILLARRAQAQKEAEQSAKRRILIAIVGGVVIGGGIAASWSFAAHKKYAREIENALQADSAPFVARGFGVVGTAEERVEATVETGCFAAVSLGPLEVEHNGEVLKTDRSAGWCSCAPEHVTVATTPARDRVTGVRLMRIEASHFGGPDGFALLDQGPNVLGKRFEECAAEQFDAWITDRHPVAHTDDSWFAGSRERRHMKELGWASIVSAPKPQPFVVFEAKPGFCFLAFAGDQDAVTLRQTGGAHPVADVKGGAIAWCASEARPWSLWREGTGKIAVLGVRAATVGGLHGMRESAASAGLPIAATWLADEDVGWDAAEALHARGVPEAQPVALDPSGELKVPESRLLSFSQLGNKIAPLGDDPPTCEPALAPDLMQTLCVQKLGTRWRTTHGLAVVGTAQAQLPFWLSIYAGVTDPDVNKSILSLLHFAGNLHALGFEPTTLAGVVESAAGVDVLGRAGDDAIVAVLLAPKAPWVFPATDGPEWSIVGEPRILELRPAERAMLTVPHAPSVPVESHRTVVFRRPAAHAPSP
jgi:hypothetical protein